MAAPPDQIAPLTTVFRSDARFSLAATATSAEDVRAKLAVKPAVVLVHAQVFDSFEDFAQYWAHYDGSLYVILPENAPPSVIESVREFRPPEM